MKIQRLQQNSRQRIIAQIYRAIVLGCIFLLVASAIVIWATPSLARQSNIRLFHAGDIEYASVYLDGFPLFEVASQEVSASASELGQSLSPIERRVRRIERNLHSIIKTDIDPKTLQLRGTTLNNLTVIIASDQKKLAQQVIVTVTEIDAQIAASSVVDLAQQWSEIIRSAVIRAWQARQPEARKRQILTGVKIVLGMIIISCLLIWGLKFLKMRFELLKKRVKKQSSTSLKSESIPSSEQTRDLLPVPLELLNTFRQHFNLEQRLTLNILLQKLLQIGLILLWFSSIAAILYTFPETRVEGRGVILIPLKIFIIWLALTVISNLIFLQVNHRLREWVEQGSVLCDEEESQRQVLRASTLLEISQGLIKFISLCIGIIWFLIWQNFPLNSLLTGAGILGASLTFVFQNLLRDWVNGILIIFEDQYAVGDMIEYNGFIGVVEQMSLRSTQIRSAGGRLSTIPHNQITTVHNLTKDWSRVDFTVEVAYDTDVTLAIELMKQVAQEMASCPQWKKDIIDPVTVIGVSRLAHSGIEIMMWIKVKRLRQWEVEREFRRRLKLAFDEKKIQIGIPKQSLLFSQNTPQN